MIYLIGGPPRCGKTTLTKHLTKKLNIPWISADTIESIVENTFLRFAGTVDSLEYERLFPKNVLRMQTKDSNDLLFKQYSPPKIADVFIKQAEAVCEAIETMVASEVSAGHDYIIEGHQVQPILVNRLKRRNYQIKAVFLIRQNVEQLSADFLKSQAKRDWVLQKTKLKNTYPKIASMIIAYSSYIQIEASKYNLPLFNMDGVDFKAKLEAAGDFLTS